MQGRTVVAVLVSFVALVLLATLGGLFAAERRARPESVEIEDPKPGEPEDAVIVAVVDTGVDANHPALKGKVLKGFNVAEVSDSTADGDGHGTSVAGLIAADDKEPEYDGVCAGLNVKILPVKITAGDTYESVPALVGRGIDRAVEAGAHVVCVAFGSTRSSESMEVALAKAREKGVIVVAAAGMTGGTHDLYPAAHPWVISCTAWTKLEIPLTDDSIRQAHGIAEKANRSGKTELMGPPEALCISAGGHRRLQGTSVTAALAAGWAAKLILKHPDWPRTQIRDVLVYAGACHEGANAFQTYPVRRLDSRALEAISDCGHGKYVDLLPIWADSIPWYLVAGKPGRLQVDVRNIGQQATGGEVVLTLLGSNESWKARFAAIQPGKTAKVSVDLPAFEEIEKELTIAVRAEGDVNPSNDVLESGIQSAKEVAGHALLRQVSTSGWIDAERPITVHLIVHNPRLETFKGVVEIEIDEKPYTRDVVLESGEDVRLEIPIFLSDPKAEDTLGKFIVNLKVGKELLCSWTVRLDLKLKGAKPQYADVWETKEVLIDAPAFVERSRDSIPFLLFFPEIHTRLDFDPTTRNWSRDTTQPRPEYGLWLSEFCLEQLPVQTALSYGCEAKSTPLGKNLIFRLRSGIKPVDRTTVQVEGSAKGSLIEDWSGKKIEASSIQPWIDRDGWHLITNVPTATLLLDTAHAYTEQGSEHSFVRGYAVVLAKEFSPVSRKAGRFDQVEGRVVHEVVLKIRLNVYLPRLFPEGQYRDMHVHTMCEFSRDAVEPRLAFGGPWWMIVRSAHAIGFIENKHVDQYRLMFKSLSGSEGGPATSVGADGTIITTDHNCFLSDADTPDAAPFSEAGGRDEWSCLREAFGRGGNQELSMAVPRRFPSAAHALVYADKFLPGPWHGGRSFLTLLAILDEIFSGKVLGELLWDKVSPVAKKTAGAATDLLVARYLNSLTSAIDATQKREALRKSLNDNGFPKATQADVDAFATAWSGVTPSEIGELRGQVAEIVRDAEMRESGDLKRAKEIDPTCKTGNPWKVALAEERIYRLGGAYIAAHPHLGARQFKEDGSYEAGMLSWEEPDLPLAANVSGAAVARFEKGFPFKGVQIWNEPHFSEQAIGHPGEVRALNPWRTGFMMPCPVWHSELVFGVYYYLKRLAGPGLTFCMEEKPNREDARKFFIRKVYHFAGSDAHGSFNFTTGVMTTLATRPRIMETLRLFDTGHDSKVHSAHFGVARVYGETPSLDSTLRGRCVSTDGPLAWMWLDGEVKFDSKALLWHESWSTPSHGTDIDAEIGGGGEFDGKRTLLVRRSGAGVVARTRCVGGDGCGGEVRQLELYRHQRSQEKPNVESGWIPKALHAWKPGASGENHFESVPQLAPDEPQLVFLGAFTGETPDERWTPDKRRCLTNPIWISSVKIGASAKPLQADGKAFVPPGAFLVEFETDHSMKEEAPTVLVKQFNTAGDSVAASYEFVPVADMKEGFWRSQVRRVNGEEWRVDDCRLIAVNKEPIPLCEPWYPQPGIDTFAVILANPRDMHGNGLNPVASKVSVAVPPPDFPAPGPDKTAVPDPVDIPDPKPVETGRSRNDGDTVCVSVTPGEKIQLPRGGTAGGQPIPPGTWTVPDGVAKTPIDVVVKMGTHVVTVTLIADGQAAEAEMVPADRGWVGVVPTPGQGAPSIEVKNASAGEIEIAQPLVVTPTCAAFAAPETQPGACSITVAQGGERKTYEVEAVAAKLAWDQATAQVGDVRVLSVALAGASDPAAWTVSGRVVVQNAEVVELAEGVERHEDGLLLDRIGGAAPLVGRFRATQEGTMSATSWLRARRK